MKIRFYLNTKKFVEAHRYSVKKWCEGACDKSEYRKQLQRYKDFLATSSKSTGNIKINLQAVYKEHKDILIYYICSLIMHETLHSAIGDEEEDTITQHSVIYDIQNALFPGSICSKTLDWYLIEDW